MLGKSILLNIVFGFLLASVGFASQNSAQINFREGSLLTKELQEAIYTAVQNQCESSASLIWSEDSTTKSSIEIDQGQIDDFYTTRLTAKSYFDGQHPVGVTLTVITSVFDISNPDVSPISVEVQGDGLIKCN